MAHRARHKGSAGNAGCASAEEAGGLTGFRFIVEPREGGPPHVELLPVTGFRLVGAAENEPDPETLRWQINLDLRDQGLLGEPVLSYAANDDGSRRTHLDWPTPVEFAEDAEYARLLTFARLPLGREIPELDSQPKPDPEHEHEVERLAAADRADHAAVVEVGKAVALAVRRSRRLKKAKPKPTPKPPVIYDGERERTGGDWNWTRFVAGPRLPALAHASGRHWDVHERRRLHAR